MSLSKSLRQASLHSLNLFFIALGGLLGLIVTAITSGWLPFWLGIGLGLYVALFLAYHNVRSDLDDLRAQLDTKAKDQSIVEALLTPLQYAVHDLYNFVNDSHDKHQIMAWKAAIRHWEHDTRELMKQIGCSPAEIASFWDHTWADASKSGELHPTNELINYYRQSIMFRINALRRIINRHAGAQVFRENE